MADPTINWLTKVITVPQSFLTPLGGLRYQLDVNAFRNALKDIEDSDDGMAYPDTHTHNTEAVLSGVAYARQVVIINGYTVTFASTGSPYQVECVGANHNLADVKNVNDVSLVVGNSAGLIVTAGGAGGGGLTPEQDTMLRELWRKEGLDATKVVTHTPSSIKVGDPLAPDFEITLTGNRKTLTTMERQ